MTCFVLKIWCLNGDIVLDRLPRSCFCTHRRYEVRGRLPSLEWRKTFAFFPWISVDFFSWWVQEVGISPHVGFLDCTWKWMVVSCHIFTPFDLLNGYCKHSKLRNSKGRIVVAAIDGWWLMVDIKWYEPKQVKSWFRSYLFSGPWYLAIG